MAIQSDVEACRRCQEIDKMDVEKHKSLNKSQPILYDNDDLRRKWKGLKDCYKNYQKQAEELSGGASRTCYSYHKWSWAENVQFLESCGLKCSNSPRISSVSLHDSSLDSKLPPAVQLVSTTSIPTTPSEKTEIFYLESLETLRIDSVLETKPPTYKNRPPVVVGLTVPSARLSEPSFHLRSSSTKRSYSNSVDDVDRIHLKRSKRGEPSEAIDLLFKSYAETFKSFSAKNQVLLKVKLAKLFADAELDDMKEPSVVFSSPSVADEHDYSLCRDSETLAR